MSKKQIKLFNGERNERYDYLVTKEQPLSYTAESFQKVIINLDYANIDGKIKVVQFTSTLASEGKSTFVSNLAYLLGQKNKKVVLLDLDLRKPKMHRVFNVANKDGLNDYLSGKIQYDQVIKHSEKFDFDFIVTGEKTTAVVNVLESAKMKELIQKLRENYDYVLLDTPPVIAVSDALYVARNADGVIFIVAQGVAKKSLVKEAIQTLKNNNVHIIGTVLTQVNLKSGEYGYGYDYSYKYEE
ncbi:MAG TPA: CpsD/CapB family tyrosine-protein kinase [Acholeplasmataceae bacterium]|nr:CpsD/CapB family tyrosine-protein kinase [Acholeplasmataceae bacterium]